MSATEPSGRGGNALTELAGLVVEAWVMLYGYDCLAAGEVEVLGPGPLARLALDRALRRRIPGSPGLGGCWTESGAAGAAGAMGAEASAPPDWRSGRTASGGEPGDLDRFLAAVLRGGPPAGAGPPGGEEGGPRA